MVASEEPPLSNSSPSAKTILIVEDDPAIGEFLQALIGLETPHTALLVHSRDKALEIVQQVKPHLFILDYYLMDVTGIELYDHLHTLDGLEHVPALIASASLDKHQQEIEQRCVMGLRKPFDLDEILQAIETLLQEV